MSTDLATTEIITADGVVTVTVVDRIGVDRLFLMLLRGSAAAKYAAVVDNTALVPRAVKDLIISPTED
jgi:hypothetical protein